MRQRVLLIVLLIAGNALSAQRFSGYIYSDYAGIIGARVQPATLADSPYKYDVSLINGNAFITNNIAFRDKPAETNGPVLIRFISDKEKFLQANLSVGGLSAMIALPRGQGLGLSFSARSHVSANDLGPHFIQQFNRFGRAEFIGSTVLNQKANFAYSAWYELGLTYAAVLSDNGFNKWKIGITPKLVNSLGGGFFRMNDLDYQIDPVSAEVLVNDLDFEFGYSSNLDEFDVFDGLSLSEDQKHWDSNQHWTLVSHSKGELSEEIHPRNPEPGLILI